MRTPWWRVLAAGLSLAVVAGGVLVAGTAQADPVATATFTVSGDSQDTVTMGKSYSYSTSKGASVEAYSDAGGTVRIAVNRPGGPYWRADFDAPGSTEQPVPGHSPILVPGTYTPVQEYPGNGTGAGMAVFATWGCAKVTGSFTVKKAVFGPQNYLQSFDATFVQHCEGVTAAARGEIRISNPPPSPPPAPSPTRASPSATASAYAPPTPEPTDTGFADAGGGATTARPSPAAMQDVASSQFLTMGSVVIALFVLAFIGLAAFLFSTGHRVREMRRRRLSPQPLPVGPLTLGGAVVTPWSTPDAVESRWQRRDPQPPPVTRQPTPGKVIATTIVLAVRGALGLLVTIATLEAVYQHLLPGRPPPSWYPHILWLQLGMSAGQLVSGVFLWRGHRWPRVLALGVLWFDIAAGMVIMFATTFSCAGMVGVGVDGAIVAMLCWSEVRDWCE